MATNKERTSSAAMRKLLLQSASKKEQEIQQIGSVAESTIPMATGLGMHNIANNILEDILTSHNKEIQAILKKYMSI